MTSKDYELIAGAIARAEISREARIIVTRHLADALSTTNPRYDRERFIFAATNIDMENDDSIRDHPELVG